MAIVATTHPVRVNGLWVLRKALESPDCLDLHARVCRGAAKLRENLDLLFSGNEPALPDVAYAPKHSNADVPHFFAAFLTRP